MKLNKTELRKIIYDFNSVSNRLMQANYNDYTDVLKKFIKYIDGTPIISDYVLGCGTCSFDIATEIQEVQSSYGECIFSTGDTEEEEVCNVYAILHYLAETNNSVYHGVATGYSYSNGYQDKIKEFNNRFVMILIRHIERYLTKVGIDMGLDDKTVFNVTVQNGQAIIATDNATVTATNTVGMDTSQIANLIKNIKEEAQNLSPDDSEVLNASLEVIEEETKSDKPRKSFIKTAISGLKAIKGSVELAAAIAALVQFIEPLI